VFGVGVHGHCIAQWPMAAPGCGSAGTSAVTIAGCIVG
jgi:hypothetical protein